LQWSLQSWKSQMTGMAQRRPGHVLKCEWKWLVRRRSIWLSSWQIEQI
jgi:hypothetical protein